MGVGGFVLGGKKRVIFGSPSISSAFPDLLRTSPENRLLVPESLREDW